MASPIDLGPVGIWTFGFDQLPNSRAGEVLAEVESLGYGAVWIPEAVGKDPLVHAGLLLSQTSRIAVCTGIAQIYARDAIAANAGLHTLTEAFPDRFVLGLGVSHQMMVEGIRKQTYAKPLTAMRQYLEAMDAAPYMGAAPSATPRRVIGALGPKMLALAAEKADGAHPYNVPVEHVPVARSVLGADRFLGPELAVALETDPAAARAKGRAHLAIYMGLPNYTNNLRRFGFGDDDFADNGSDRLVDALVAWGDESTIAKRVAEFRDAGADHVAVQVLVERGPGGGPPIDAWRRLAPALLGG